MQPQQSKTEGSLSAGPVAGVPQWAHASLFRWLGPMLTAQNRAFVRGELSPEFLQLVERRQRISLDWSASTWHALDDLKRRMRADEGLFLAVLALAFENISVGYSVQEEDAATTELEKILTEAGMDIRVDIQRIESNEQWHGRPIFQVVRTLQRRTSPEVAATVAHVIRHAPGGGRHLGEAWALAFGPKPDPVKAYSEAVKAVEDVAVPLVLPDDPTATLGKVIAALRSAPHKWRAVFPVGVPILDRNNKTSLLQGRSELTSIEVITTWMALLWRNQTDRHAPAPPVGQAEAENAVRLAAILVDLLSNAIVRVPPEASRQT